jgi:hypothetical protein
VVAAGVGRFAQRLLGVGPVLGHDRSAHAGQQWEQLLVLEPFELGALVHGDDVVAALARAGRDRLAVEPVEDELRASRSWPARRVASARSETARSRPAISSISSR